MRRLGVVAACLAVACSHTESFRPADVPRLARFDADESVHLTRLDGTSFEVVRYKEVRLIPKGDARGYVLRRPIRVHRFEEQTWLKSGSYAPILFDAEDYSRAEIEHSNRGETAAIAVVAGVFGVIGLFMLMPPRAARN